MCGLGRIPSIQLFTLLNPGPKPPSIATLPYLIAIGPRVLQVARSKI